jgi:clan AA aspartic protease (TIGR02281 family)
MLGLGLHRHAPAWVISLTATVLVFGPPIVAAAMSARARVPLFGTVLGFWSIGILGAMPVYFPGERRQAVVTGMSLVGLGPGWELLARAVADELPGEPQIAEPEVPEATALVEAVLPAPAPLEDHQIALPYEGAGRRLSVQVTFENGENVLDADMMLDTGATYTTLPLETLAALGIVPDDDDPTIYLHTANGEREARVVLLDGVWLGDLQVRGVAVATCEACASADTVGLLGLNVTGGYNMMIDADRHEVVFTTRTDQNRRLDIAPFTELSASLSRYPGGRMEVVVRLASTADRPIRAAKAEIRCEDNSWSVELGDVPADGEISVRRRLPEHETCDRYQVALQSATW